MRTSAVEPIGLLCRWLLLLLIAGIMAVAAWAGALAAHSVAGDVGAVMVIPDAALELRPSTQLRGLIAPPVRTDYFSPVMCSSAGQPLRFGQARGKWVYPQLHGGRRGRNRLTVRGLPYSAFAYQQAEVQVSLVGSDTVVFLIDARLIRPGADLASLAASLRQMRRRGQAVWFHPGPIREFLDARRAVGEVDPSIPITSDLAAQPDARQTLRYATARLARHKAGKRKPFVVTGHGALACWADAAGFLCCLVGPDGAEALPARVLRVESWAKLEEYLSAQPISQ